MYDFPGRFRHNAVALVYFMTFITGDIAYGQCSLIEK